MKTVDRVVTIAICLAAFLSPHAGAAIIAGPFTNTANNHVYYLLSTNSWTAAQAEAVSLGGHLVTINDAAEQQWITNTFLPRAGSHRIWIGLTDRDIQGTFLWWSGETAGYRNWFAGEPNNSSVEQGYVHIYPTNEARVGFWNDVAESQAADYFAIAEVILGVPTQARVFQAVEIAWPTQTTNRYQIQWSSSLNTNEWFSLGSPIQGTGSTNYHLDSTRDAAKRFYRILTLAP